MPFNVINGINQYQVPISAVETIASLRAIPDADSPTWTTLAFALTGGGTTFRDGVSRLYMWDPTLNTADNGDSVIKPTDITGAGRWRLVAGGGSGAAGAALYAGSGSPEGVQVAQVGSIYVDTATGNLYKKVSGTGNTGWV